MFETVHRFAPESTRTRAWTTLLLGVVAALCLALIFISHGTTVPLLVAAGGIAAALALTLGVGLTKQAEAAPETANPAWKAARTAESDTSAVETLQRRYAEGDVGDTEFERRMDALLESDVRHSTNEATTENTTETTASATTRRTTQPATND